MALASIDAASEGRTGLVGHQAFGDSQAARSAGFTPIRCNPRINE